RALDVFLFSLSPSSFIAVTSIHFFFSLLRLPPSSTLFPYTTLFRSLEPPHLDHLDHELDFAILPLVEAQSDHAVRDVFHEAVAGDRKSTRLNSSHQIISYAVFCLKKKKKKNTDKI